MDSKRNDPRRANVLDPTKKVKGSEPNRNQNGGKEKGIIFTARRYLSFLKAFGIPINSARYKKISRVSAKRIF